ncbi:hypothetical protein MMC27_008595 [Xylographa pallens]|nr:hypothetical protein [Xylographa pallens]
MSGTRQSSGRQQEGKRSPPSSGANSGRASQSNQQPCQLNYSPAMERFVHETVKQRPWDALKDVQPNRDSGGGNERSGSRL